MRPNNLINRCEILCLHQYKKEGDTPDYSRQDNLNAVDLVKDFMLFRIVK